MAILFNRDKSFKKKKLSHVKIITHASIQRWKTTTTPDQE